MINIEMSNICGLCVCKPIEQVLRWKMELTPRNGKKGNVPIHYNSISNPKLIAGDASFFSIVHGTSHPSKNPNHAISKTRDWVFQLKSSFTLTHLNKPPKSYLLIKYQNYPLVLLNNKYIEQFSSQKHLGLNLDSRLNFKEYFDKVFKTGTQKIGVLWKFKKIF